MKTVPMIDIFAGPGGLSEGFSRYNEWFDDASVRYRSVLSIEKDAVAVRTLTLRAFYRMFDGDLPEEYWKVLRGETSVDTLRKFPEWKSAVGHVWQAELGKIPIDQLHGRIELRLKGADDWLLIGGPPCQAYSLMGRARMTGIGFDARSDVEGAVEAKRQRLEAFNSDERHVLYREYLRVIAVHQPSAFVMENVKGILSAKLPDADGKAKLMFERIRGDLHDPWAALADDQDIDELLAMARPGKPKYRLYALSGDAEKLWKDEPANSDFLLKSENFGVPQKRHRVIVVGVRDDHPGAPDLLKHVASTTVRDAIGHLPRIRSGFSSAPDVDEDWHSRRFAASSWLLSADLPETVKTTVREALEPIEKPLTRGSVFAPALTGSRKNTALEAWLSSPDLRGYSQHESRSHMESDVVRYLYASSSATVTGQTPRLHQWPAELLPKHRNVTIGSSGKIDVTGFVDRFKVQVWHEPSSTVTSHIAKDGHYFIHPDPAQNRSLTVREAARLQTFPDDYYFCGNRSEQYHQVGNAVPPLLAVQLARSVAALFKAQLPITGTREKATALD